MAPPAARPPVRPPFRADHVGSLLRPASLAQARDRFKRGELAARCEDLHQRWGLPTAKWVRGFKPLAA